MFDDEIMNIKLKSLNPIKVLDYLLRLPFSTNQMLFKEKEIIVKNNKPKDITINADRLHIEELSNNLLNNAVKYTTVSGMILIDAASKKDRVWVSIKDNGQGVTKSQIDHIFTEFYKANSSQHDFESNDLGLPICKRIVNRHSGKNYVESEGLKKDQTFISPFQMSRILSMNRISI